MNTISRISAGDSPDKAEKPSALEPVQEEPRRRPRGGIETFPIPGLGRNPLPTRGPALIGAASSIRGSRGSLPEIETSVWPLLIPSIEPLSCRISRKTPLTGILPPSIPTSSSILLVGCESSLKPLGRGFESRSRQENNHGPQGGRLVGMSRAAANECRKIGE